MDQLNSIIAPGIQRRNQNLCEDKGSKSFSLSGGLVLPGSLFSCLISTSHNAGNILMTGEWSGDIFSCVINSCDWVFFSRSQSGSAFVQVAAHFPPNPASYLCYTVSILLCRVFVLQWPHSPWATHTRPQSLVKQWSSFLHTLSESYDRVWLWLTGCMTSSSVCLRDRGQQP